MQTSMETFMTTFRSTFFKTCFLLPLLSCLLVYSEPVQADVDLDVNPRLPVNCHDGLVHRRLNGVSNINVTETETQVLLTFKAYMLDCHTEKDEVVPHFYGPLHPGRCDLSVRPYPGVRVKTMLVALDAEAPYDKTPVCGVGIVFDKKVLKPVGNNLLYVYRYNGLGEYRWDIDIRLNAENIYQAAFNRAQ